MSTRTIELDIDKFRVQVVSDVHLELRSGVPQLTPSAEILALCGDIGAPNQTAYEVFLRTASKNYKWVFLIAGNHEFYHAKKTPEELKDVIRDITEKFPNITFLDDNAVTVNYGGAVKKSIRIFGSTLWSNTSAYVQQVKSIMNDYRRINQKVYVGGGTLYRRSNISPDNTITWHLQAVEMLEREIEYCKEADLRLVVLTHHLPSLELIHEDFRGDDATDSAYASNLDHLIFPPIVFWAHGHSHRCGDTYINGVRIVSNPMGYPSENTKKYSSGHHINIDN